MVYNVVGKLLSKGFFLYIVFLLQSIAKKKGRTGGRSLLARSAKHWQRGEGEPRATNGQAQKITCRPPQVDHKE